MARVLLAVVTAISALAGCASQPIPELLAAAAPSSDAPMSLSGEARLHCLDAVTNGRPMPGLSDFIYDPVITYNVAEIIFKSYGSGAEHANRLRAYKATTQGKNIFGQAREAGYVCLVEKRGSQMIFLEDLRLEEGGRISQSLLAWKVGAAYKKMSGKSSLEVFFNQ